MHRGRRSAAVSLALTSSLTLVGFVLDSSAGWSAPLLSGRVGGLALIGPASPHPASMITNPAALALLGGGHLALSSTAALQRASVARRDIDHTSGDPLLQGSTSHSVALDLTSESYVGATTALGTDYLVVGLAVYNSWDSVSYLQGAARDYFDAAAQDTATRYHGSSLAFANLFTTVAAAVRVTERIHLGLLFSYVHGWVDYRFVRDVALSGGSRLDPGENAALDSPCPTEPCGYENDQAAEAVHAKGESDGLAFGAGVVMRLHPRVDIGLGYRSAIVGFGAGRISATDDAWVQRAAVTGQRVEQELSQSEGRRAAPANPSGRSKIIYQLPHTVSAGVWWRARPGLALDFQASWQSFRLHDVLDMRLTGAAFQASPQIPDRIVHYRGFQDVLSGQVGAQWDLRPQLRIQGAAMVANSAVKKGALTGTSIDNWNVDALLAVRWRVIPPLTIGAGYGIVWVPTAEVTESAFHPSSFAHCVDGSFDIELDECQEASRGRGLASTVGRYSRVLHRFALSLDYVWP